MNALQTLQLLPDRLRPGDLLPDWEDRMVISVSRGPFGHVLVQSDGNAPLALPATRRVTAYREREAA